MTLRRLLPLGAALTALLVVAGIASHGRPLSSSHHAEGPTAHFFDYVFTTIVLLCVLGLVALVLAATARVPFVATPRPRRSWWQSLVAFLAFALAASYLMQHAHFRLVLRQNQSGAGAPRPAQAQPGRDVRRRPARVQWDEIAIVAALLACAGAVLFATRYRGVATRAPWRRPPHEQVFVALDESIDDLLRERDLRRAIIAAYARMEHALAVAGYPRRAAEAPLEYMERTLLSLDTSAASVRRLTDLFEWAKFSQHEPEPAMRDEAVAALVAVREELRRPAEVAA